jgi:hypothetical protein
MDVEIATPASKKSAFDFLNKRVSLITSLIAILAAMSGIFASRCTTRGQVFKNNAIQAQESISNEWAYYQSRNFRIEIADLGTLILSRLPGAQKTDLSENTLRLKRERLTREKQLTFEKARQLEQKRDKLDLISINYFDLGKYFASALVIFQIALMLIPIVLIGRKLKVLDYTVTLSLAGLVVLAFSFIRYFSVIFLVSHLS